MGFRLFSYGFPMAFQWFSSGAAAAASAAAAAAGVAVCSVAFY